MSIGSHSAHLTPNERNESIMHITPKRLAALLIGGTALVVPVLIADSASAATAPTQTAVFEATQPSGGGGNWDHHYTVQVAADGTFSGVNHITGLDAGQTVGVDETVTGQFTDKNNDGVTEVSLTAVRGSGFYTFQWSVTDAPMDGKVDSMTDGTVTYATAVDWHGGPLPITFTPQSGYTPGTQKGTHGEFVSGATHAGVKGKDLAAIAKDVTLVGPYDPAKVNH